MTNDKQPRYILGIDYGTDSCRAVVTDAQNGKEVATATALYPRWAKAFIATRPKTNSVSTRGTMLNPSNL